MDVKKHGQIIELRIYEFGNTRDEIFRGQARVDNRAELETLFSAAESKGLKMPNISGTWWR